MAASSFSQNTKCDCSKLKSRSCVHAIMKRKKPKTDDLRGLSAFVFIVNKLDPFEKSFHKLIRVSKHSKTIKALGLRPRAFISFLAFGNRGDTLALVYGILHQKTSTRNQINLISLSSSLCKHICYVVFNLFFTKYISAGYDDTDFDSKALGMWENAGKIQWRRKQFFTQTAETGPSRDHTTGKGVF